MPIVNALPNTITNGQLVDAVPVMANFNWLVSQVNGNACPATIGSGVLKGNGTGGTSTAVAGTDYAGIGSVNTFTALQSGIAAVAAANFPITSQVQQSAFNTGASGGTADAITVTFTPTITSLTSAPIWWRATAANATTTPTLKRDGLVAKTIVKGSNQALVAGDIPGAGAWMCSQYDATLDKEVLLNPAYASIASNIAGGAAGSVPYQTGAGATTMLAKGTDGQVLTLASGVPSWASVITAGTVKTATGVELLFDFTGIPATAKRVTIEFNGVSTSGTSGIVVQIGSGSVDSTATYGGASGRFNAGGAGYTSNSTSFTLDTNSANAADVLSGTAVLTLVGSNTWVLSSTTSRTPTAAQVNMAAGTKALSGALDRVRITTGNGTDAFDVGSINILYE